MVHREGKSNTYIQSYGSPNLHKEEQKSSHGKVLPKKVITYMRSIHLEMLNIKQTKTL